MSYKQAVDDVRKLTRYFKSLDSICTALDGIASIEQASNEAQQRLVDQRKNVEIQLADEIKRLNDMCAKSDAMDAEIADRKTKAEAEAKRIVSEAQAECDDERKRLAAQREDSKRAENEAYAELNLVNEELKTAKETLAQVTEQIEAAKAAIRKFAE